jgi:hypothetical protein
MIHHFLLVYDRRKGQLVETTDFGRRSSRALAAYEAREREVWDQPWMEVVLLGSDSLETIKITHPNYFSDFKPTSRLLGGLFS